MDGDDGEDDEDDEDFEPAIEEEEEFDDADMEMDDDGDSLQALAAEAADAAATETATEAAAEEAAALEEARSLPIADFKDLDTLMCAALRLLRAGSGAGGMAAPTAARKHDVTLVKICNRSICGVCGAAGARFACIACKVRFCNPKKCQCATKHIRDGLGNPVEAAIEPADVPEFGKSLAAARAAARADARADAEDEDGEEEEEEEDEVEEEPAAAPAATRPRRGHPPLPRRFAWSGPSDWVAFEDTQQCSLLAYDLHMTSCELGFGKGIGEAHGRVWIWKLELDGLRRLRRHAVNTDNNPCPWRRSVCDVVPIGSCVGSLHRSVGLKPTERMLLVVHCLAPGSGAWGVLWSLVIRVAVVGCHEA